MNMAGCREKKVEKVKKKQRIMAKCGERQCFSLWGDGNKIKSQRGEKGIMNYLRKDCKHSTKARSSCSSSNSMGMLNEKIGRATSLHHG